MDAQERNKEKIYKDVQKLLREPVWGLWFHLLESADSKTIPSFLEVIREGIGRCGPESTRTTSRIKG